jgi:hypothetical protein
MISTSIFYFIFLFPFQCLGFKNWNTLVHIISILDICRSMFAIDFFDFAKSGESFPKMYFTLKLFAKFMFKCPKKFLPKNHWFWLWPELLLNVYDVAIAMANPNISSVVFTHATILGGFFLGVPQLKSPSLWDMLIRKTLDLGHVKRYTRVFARRCFI